MMALLALLPILLIILLMAVFGRSAAFSAAAGLVVGLGVAVAGFDPGGPAALAGVAAEAAFLAATILWIIFAALCLHELQTATGAMDRIRGALSGLSADPRILALLLGWFFALFIEGAAGFGTPAALTAPMLAALGFPPVRAVVLALVGHAAGVSFGAVGTPVLPQLAVSGFSGLELARSVAILHGTLGWVLVLFLIRNARLDGVGAPGAAVVAGPVAGWAALAAAGFLLPYLAIAWFVGPELPSLGGALVGGTVFMILWRRFGAPGSGADGAGSRRVLLAAGAPYLVLLLLILVTRLWPDLQAALRSADIAWSLPGGFSGRFEPLYHPGTMLLAGFLLGGLVQGASGATLAGAARRAVGRLPKVALALVCMLALARLMVHAGMVRALADAASIALGPVWPVLSPLVGVLGAFVTGSATASNILFTDFQQATATALGLPVLPLLGAQNFGAAVGNIICPHNIIAACALVGLAGREGEVLRRTLGPCLIYVALGGALTALRVALAGAPAGG